MQINDGGTAYPMQDAQAIHAYAAARTPEHGTTKERDRAYTAARAEAVGGMSLRDAMAMSVRLPDEYSAKWCEALIDEQMPNGVEPASVHIDWWMRVEAAYRYRLADAMIRAREQS